jgi:hypothetical protein
MDQTAKRRQASAVHLPFSMSVKRMADVPDRGAERVFGPDYRHDVKPGPAFE